MNQEWANPYVGPRHFEEEDGRFFYGRNQEVEDLRAFVIAEPVVLIHSPSGAGKSSLIQARLVPGLREVGFEVLPVARLAGELPAQVEDVHNIFVFHLLWSLVNEAETGSMLPKMRLLDYLQTLPEPTTSNGQPGAARILIIDQFEEIFTTYPERWQEREQFFGQLGQALKHSSALWVLFSVREEYVAALQPYAHYLPGRFEARFYLQPLLPEAAREAIEEPARQGGRPFAPGVATILVNNLRRIQTQNKSQIQLGQFVEPVQLQIVCSQLWQKLKDKPAGELITTADIKGLGGTETAVDEALAQFYRQTLEVVYQQHPVPELTLRRWFGARLITEAGTRGRVPRGAYDSGGISNEIVSILKNHLLLREGNRGGTVWYELVHDRFIDAIILDNNRWFGEAHPLIHAAESWEHSGRKSEYLHLGKQLEDGLAKNPDLEKVDPLIRAFLENSQRVQKQLEDEKEAGELKKKNRLLRRRIAILGIAALTFLGLILLAILQAVSAKESQGQAEKDSTRAIEQRLVAEVESTRAVNERATAEIESSRSIEQRAIADVASTRAEDSRLTAEVARSSAMEQQATADAESTRAVEQAAVADAESTRAVEQRATADMASAQIARQNDLLLSQSLAFRALNVNDLGNDFELALLLALEALRLNQGGDNDLQTTIDIALSPVRDALDFNLILRGHEGAVNDVVFSPSGQIVASAGADGTIRTWDMSDPAIPSEALREHDGPVYSVLFSGENRLISAGEDGRVLEWDLTNTANSPALLVHEEDAISAMDYVPDGPGGHQFLALSRDDGIVNLWDIDRTNPTPVPLTRADGTSHPVTFFAQGGYLILVGHPDSSIQQWPVFNPFQTPTARASSGHDSAAITALAHNHAANLSDMILASGSTTIYIDYNNNNFTLSAHFGLITSLDFATAYNILASGGSEGLVYLWRIPFQMPQHAFRGHVGAIKAVDFSPDDRWLGSAGSDGLIRLWRLWLPAQNDQPLAVLVCQQIHRNLTWEEWQLYINRPLYHRTCENLPVHPSVPSEAIR